MNKKFGIKDVVAIGIGTALFVALTQISIPIGIPNTQLAPRMAILAFFSAVFGPIVGGVIGLLGHALGDAIFYGGIWWSWVFPELVLGVIIGLATSKYGVKEGGFNTKSCVMFNALQVIGNLIAWIVVAPVLDILVYAEPVNKVFIQGAFAALGNILIMGVLGSILLFGYSKISTKSSSLSKED